jgi:transposase
MQKERHHVEVLFERCCGLDVHQQFVVAGLSIVQGGQRRKEIRRFGMTTNQLLALRDWLLSQGCTHVAMESTGIYWKPIYRRLIGFFEVWLVNARNLKAVPGRKTDVQDAIWIADLMQHGLLRPSLVPGQQQQIWRDLTRARSTVVAEHTRLVNRVHKLLEDAGFKLRPTISDVFGVSGRAMLHALCEGERDPERLARLAHPRLRASQEQLVEVLTGDLREHQRWLLCELLELVEATERALSRLDREIAEQMRPFEESLARLEQITGVSRRVLHVLFAEVGMDMTPFADAAHLASWAGMCPGHDESAGKRRSGRSRPGNRYLRSALVQAAHATERTTTYLGEQYRRLKKRRGSKRAAVAVGHSILVIYYHMMKTGEPYQEKGVAFFQQVDRPRLRRQLVRRLQQLGYQVSLQPQPAA